MTTFDMVALERDEQFNTRISGYIGWQQAARKLIPTPRHAAQFDLTQMVLESGAKTTAEAVDYLMWRMLRVPAAKATRDTLGGVPDQGAGDRQHRPRQDLHGRRAAHDRAPGHEHAGVSAGVRPPAGYSVRTQKVNHMHRLPVVVLIAVLNAPPLVVGAQAPISPQTHFDAGRYQDAINTIAAQTGDPSPELIFLAGRSHLHLNRPEEARAQFARLSTDVNPATAWSLVGESCNRARRRQSSIGDRVNPGGGAGAGSVSSQLSARARAERGRAVGTSRGRVRKGVKHRSGICLRPLLRRPCVFEAQADRPHGDASRRSLKACPKRAGAGGGDRADAKRTRSLNWRCVDYRAAMIKLMGQELLGS